MRGSHLAVAAALALSSTLSAQYYSQVQTFAGTTTSGLTNGPLATARFYAPYSLCIDRTTNTIYVADTYNECIRKIQNGQVTTLAGSGIQGDEIGPGASARFYHPTGVDFYNGYVYVCDDGNHRIKRIDGQGNVSYVAGDGSPGTTNGAALSARFYNPTEVRVNSTGIIYVSDYGNNTIRKIENGQVTTLAGSPGQAGDQLGTGSAARFNRPTGLAFDDQDNLYVADQVNCKVKKVTAGGVVTLLAGSGQETTVDGTGAQASFMKPTYMGWDPTGALMIGEWEGNVIRRVTLNGVVTTAAGTGIAGYHDGPVQDAMFNAPYGICVDAQGNGYIGDKLNNCIRILYKSGNEPQGVAEQGGSHALDLFPNPAKDVLHIDLGSVRGQVQAMEILDATGRSVRVIISSTGLPGSDVQMIPIADLAIGRYTMILRTRDTIYRAAFIKE